MPTFLMDYMFEGEPHSCVRCPACPPDPIERPQMHIWKIEARMRGKERQVRQALVAVCPVCQQMVQLFD